MCLATVRQRDRWCVCVCVWEGQEESVCACGLADLGSRAKRDGCSNSGCSHPPIKLQMLLLSIEKGQGGGVSDHFNAPEITLSRLDIYLNTEGS